MLFLQGTRDALADLTLLRPIAAKLAPLATLDVIDTADHSFHVLKSSGKSDGQILHALAETTHNWAQPLKAG
jgi:predicted alpha/beta-hydrolase family hydrolase